MQSFELLQGDCIKVLATLPDASVQCCVTSPPYWGLRDYGADSQLGLEATPEEYVANMVAVFREVRRVLRDDGTLWLNLGDSYASIGHKKSNSGYGTSGLSGGIAQKHFPLSHENNGDGLKNKDLVGIPWRVAFALQADGWWLRQDIIWHKPNPMPESVTDRCTKAHEYIFLLTKSAKYFYDSEAVKERGAMVAGDSAGSSQRDTQETHGLGGGNSGINLAKQKLAAELQEKGYSTRNKRSVWTVTTKPFRGAHFATFPPDLIEPCILAGTSENGQCPKCGKSWKRIMEKIGVSTYEKMGGKNGGYKKMREESMRRGETGVGDTRDSNGNIVWYEATPKKFMGWQPDCVCRLDPIASVVLDPFSGAGTTGLVAVQHGRRYIGIELNPDYLEMSRKRIQLACDKIVTPLL